MTDEEELTSEQITELKTKATKADELEKAIAEREAKLKEYEEDEKMIDWRKARNQIKVLKGALEKEGKEFDEEANEVRGVERKYSPEEVEKLARVTTERVLIEKALSRAQKELSDEDKQVFQRYYEKATHGEDVNSDNIEEFVDMAFRLAGTGTQSKSLSDRSAGTRGGAPRMADQSKDFSDTDAGKDVLARMGLPTESKTKK